LADGQRPLDDELLLKMRNGDEDAFLALYRRWQGHLYRFALRMSGRPALAEDVVQEVFMVLIHEARGYDTKRGALSSYLYGVARNKLYRRLQREEGFVPLDEQSDEAVRGARADVPREDPHLEAARRQRADLVWDAVLTLPTHYREVLVLCELQEQSYEEAAAALGCAVGTVRSRLHRGRELLSAKLHDCLGNTTEGRVAHARR
jgi:RNA polymerase sigma-70 factor, ECF subfamily